jgi:hypothetical protein
MFRAEVVEVHVLYVHYNVRSSIAVFGNIKIKKCTFLNLFVPQSTSSYEYTFEDYRNRKKLKEISFAIRKI